MNLLITLLARTHLRTATLGGSNVQSSVIAAVKTNAEKKTNKRSTVSPKQDGGAGDSSSTLYGPKGARIPNFKGLSSLSSQYSNRATEQILYSAI